METNNEVTRLAHMFFVLGEPSRLLIVTLLMERAISVGELTESLAMSQSAVSHQLRILRDAQIVKSTKVGRKVFYSINDQHVYTIVEAGLKHMLH